MRLYKAAIAGALTLPMTSMGLTTATAAEPVNYNSMTNNKCKVSVSDVTKVDLNPDTGRERIWFNVKLKCDAGRQVKYIAEIRRKSGTGSVLLNTVGREKYVDATKGKSDHWWSETGNVSGPNKFYMRVKIRVRATNEGPWPWSAPLDGPVETIDI